MQSATSCAVAVPATSRSCACLEVRTPAMRGWMTAFNLLGSMPVATVAAASARVACNTHQTDVLQPEAGCLNTWQGRTAVRAHMHHSCPCIWGAVYWGAVSSQQVSAGLSRESTPVSIDIAASAQTACCQAVSQSTEDHSASRARECRSVCVAPKQECTRLRVSQAAQLTCECRYVSVETASLALAASCCSAAAAAGVVAAEAMLCAKARACCAVRACGATAGSCGQPGRARHSAATCPCMTL